MKKETVPTQKPETTPATPEQAARERGLFYGAVLAMSWQLAVVVLLPILGGHLLDKRLDSEPLWTTVGFAVAVAAACVVVWRQARTVSPSIATSKKPKEHQR